MFSRCRVQLGDRTDACSPIQWILPIRCLICTKRQSHSAKRAGVGGAAVPAAVRAFEKVFVLVGTQRTAFSGYC